MANFHVLRETRMPAILVECGFMTNREEYGLLKSDAYRRKCAEAIVIGIVEVYGLKKKDLAPAEPPPAITDTAWVVANGREIGTGYLIDGRTYVPLRAVWDALGLKVDWDPDTKTASLTGNEQTPPGRVAGRGFYFSLSEYQVVSVSSLHANICLIN
jgi:hypothetical protein